MKSILMSKPPKQVANIISGKQTIIVSKTAPKCELPIKVYVYCTRTIKPLSDYDWGEFTFDDLPKLGKVVAKFTLSKIERVVSCIAKDWGDDPWEMRYALRLEESDTAHNDDQLIDEGGFKNEYIKLIYGYLGFDFPTGYSIGERLDFKEGVVYGYAWHISDLEIFDEPKELSEFKYEKKKVRLTEKYHWKTERLGLVPVKKAPQSWQYVEEKE